MKQNDNNKWLEEIRGEMLDFEAAIPANGWERVSAAMPQSKSISLTRRWWRVAASLLLCISIAGGYTLLYNNKSGIAENSGNNTTEGIRNDNSLTTKTTPTAKELATLASPHKPQTITTYSHDYSPNTTEQKTTQVDTAVLVTTYDKAETTTLPDKDEALPEKKAITMTERSENDMVYSPHRKEQLLAVAQTHEHARHSNRWAFGMNIGGHGSLMDADMANFNSGPMFDDPMSEATTCPSSPTGDTNSTEPTDGVVESNHHSSWTVGLSVSKGISQHASIETGLTYTLLTSDVRLQYSGVQSQHIHYLGIPLRLNYIFAASSPYLFYAGGGITLEHVLSASRDGKKLDASPWQLSSNIAIGGQYQATRNLSFYLEPGISWYHNADKTIPTLRTESPIFFNLKGGIRFSY